MAYDNGYAVIIPVYTVLVMLRMSSVSGVFGKLQNYLLGKLQFPSHRVGSSVRPGIMCPTTRLGDSNGQMASWSEVKEDAESAMQAMILACTKQGFNVDCDKHFWETPREIMEFSAVREVLNETLQDQIAKGCAAKGGPFGLPAVMKPVNLECSSSSMNSVYNNSQMIMPNMISSVNSPTLIPVLQIHKKELDCYKSKIEKLDVSTLAQTDFQVLSLGPAKSEILVNQLQNSLQQTIISMSELDAKWVGHEMEMERMKKSHKAEIERLQKQSVDSVGVNLSDSSVSVFNEHNGMEFHSTPVPAVKSSEKSSKQTVSHSILASEHRKDLLGHFPLSNNFTDNVSEVSVSDGEQEGDRERFIKTGPIKTKKVVRKRPYVDQTYGEVESNNFIPAKVPKPAFGDLSCLDDL